MWPKFGRNSMFRLGTNCAQAVRGWGQKSVGKLPQLPHLFAIQGHFAHTNSENPLTFTTQPAFVAQAFPRRILTAEQRHNPCISTVSTPPTITTTIYI